MGIVGVVGRDGSVSGSGVDEVCGERPTKAAIREVPMNAPVKSVSFVCLGR